VLREDSRNGTPGVLLDLGVNVDGLPAKALRDESGDRRFPGAGEADEANRELLQTCGSFSRIPTKYPVVGINRWFRGSAARANSSRVTAPSKGGLPISPK